VRVPVVTFYHLGLLEEQNYKNAKAKVIEKVLPIDTPAPLSVCTARSLLLELRGRERWDYRVRPKASSKVLPLDAPVPDLLISVIM